MKAPLVVPACLQQSVGACNVGVDERLGVSNRFVIVAFGGKVHDGLVVSDQGFNQLLVTDIPNDEGDSAGRQTIKIVPVGGIGQLVEHRDANMRIAFECESHKVTADETAATGDQQGVHGVRHGSSFPLVNCHTESTPTRSSGARHSRADIAAGRLACRHHGCGARASPPAHTAHSGHTAHIQVSRPS